MHRMTSTKVSIGLVLSLLVLSIAAPLGAEASTMNVTLYPSSNTAQIVAVTQITMALTYPANSPLSTQFSGYSNKVSYSSTVQRAEGAYTAFESDLKDRNGGISVQNMSVSMTMNAVGNGTALVVTKDMSITAWIKGAFAVVNGTVRADMGWRSFAVKGPMYAMMNGHEMDINDVGDSFMAPLGGKSFGMDMVMGAFGGDWLWKAATVNYSSLDSPLSTWTKTYNSAANTTTFSKTINTQFLLSSSVSMNGQNYSMQVTYDPQATITTQGYAQVQGSNSLAIYNAAPGQDYGSWAIDIAGIVVAAGVIWGLIALRRRTKKAILQHA